MPIPEQMIDHSAAAEAQRQAARRRARRLGAWPLLLAVDVAIWAAIVWQIVRLVH